MTSRDGLYKPFLYTKAPQILPPSTLILPSHSTVDASGRETHQHTYKKAVGTALSALFIGTLVFSAPVSTSAFWPFSRSAFAANTGGEPPIVHDSSMQLLAAATNEDPNPAKGIDNPMITEGSALVANAGPEGTLADITDTSTGGQISTYIVKDGDTIASVAKHFDVSVSTIVWANSLNKKSTLAPGTSLVILPVSGVQHRVIAGETLQRVAKKFNADATDIASYNGLDVTDSLTAGDLLIIPGGEISNAPSTPVKTPTTTKKPTTKASYSSKIKQGGGLTSIKGNPYRGGSGEEIDGYYTSPVPGGLVTQGIHGWNGVDLGAPSGTPIHAAAGGTVIVSRIGGWNGGYGNYVVISHGNGTQTLYSHLSSDSVSVGDSVSRGEVIGGVGRTGDATGNHLHYEVRGARNPFAACDVMTVCSPQ